MSFPRYERYKDSGVEWLGEVPEHWKIRALRYSARIMNGTDFKHLEVLDGGYPVVGSGGAFARVSEFMYDRPSVLLGRKGTIDKPLYMDTPFWAVDTMYYTVISSDSAAKFVYYFAKCIPFELFTYGTALPSMTQTTLHALPMALPSLQDQSKIVSFLDAETAKIDALIEEQQRLIELLKEKRQAYISHLVTKGLNADVEMKDSGVEWMGRIPTSWHSRRLSDLITTRKGIAFKAENFTDEGVGVVKASDVKGLTVKESGTWLPLAFISQYPKAILSTDEIILSTVGSTPEVRNSAVGQLGRLPAGLAGHLLNQNTVIFTPKQSFLHSDFLFLALQTTSYRDHLDLHAHGTANQVSLNVADMLNFSIPIPDHHAQTKIVTAAKEETSRIDLLIAESNCVVDILQERRSALISAAVTGKIDIRNYAPKEAA